MEQDSGQSRATTPAPAAGAACSDRLCARGQAGSPRSGTHAAVPEGGARGWEPRAHVLRARLPHQHEPPSLATTQPGATACGHAHPCSQPTSVLKGENAGAPESERRPTPHQHPGRASRGQDPGLPDAGRRRLYLECLVLALGRLRRQVGASAVAEAVRQSHSAGRAASAGQRHSTRHRVRQLDAKADFEPTPRQTRGSSCRCPPAGEGCPSDPGEPPHTTPGASASCRPAFTLPSMHRAPRQAQPQSVPLPVSTS